MAVIGQIELGGESGGIDADRWIELIASHPNLSPIPPRMGINPFTRAPYEFKAPPTSAVVYVQGAKIGNIFWAMDGSPLLVVDAEQHSQSDLASIAHELARTLDAKFVPRANDD